MNDHSVTGGCQCGAVRYRAGGLGRASICHCRMCQKAFGGFFGPLVSVGTIVWTRGARAIYHSSNVCRRGFCAGCGTPLTYEHEKGMEVAIGSLDQPGLAAPTVQLNRADRCEFVDRLAALPVVERTAAEENWYGKVVSCQHPDHDTATWPLPDKGSA